MHIIIEGIDHCGKDTLINNIQNKYGGNVFHSGKPKLLKMYEYSKNKNTKDLYEQICLTNLQKYSDSNECEKLKTNCALYQYQLQYFRNIFSLIAGNITCITLAQQHITKIEKSHILYNRLHLGEYVYGKLYRDYTNTMMNSVFYLEKEILCKNNILQSDFNNVHLFLLYMHHPENRKYDSDAFNFDNAIKEQELFLEAFNKSLLRKSIIYVDNLDGKWKSQDEILLDVEKYLFF